MRTRGVDGLCGDAELAAEVGAAAAGAGALGEDVIGVTVGVSAGEAIAVVGAGCADIGAFAAGACLVGRGDADEDGWGIAEGFAVIAEGVVVDLGGVGTHAEALEGALEAEVDVFVAEGGGGVEAGGGGEGGERHMVVSLRWRGV